MIVNSYNQEFGYELLSAVPYAYELHLKGELKATISGLWSDPFYYFSPKHQINLQTREWNNTNIARKNKLPYTTIHRPELEPKNFPPYKDIYANNDYKWEKPTLCICNRANVEWSYGLINYFDTEILDWLFKNLKKHYKIIYFPVSIPKEIQDNVDPAEIGDIDIAKKHNVTIFPDLIGDNTWNEVLLRVFTNCEHYITMNGGYSILASYFSGQNIIYSLPSKGKRPQTRELVHKSFWRWYPNINNVQSLHVSSYENLKAKVKALYIDKLPTANVIIRTSKRPYAFKRAITSVLSQDYPNINIVVVCDDKSSLAYTRGYNCRIIEPERPKRPDIKPAGEDYGRYFPSNDYLKQAIEKVSGYIIAIDDDDVFLKDTAISTIMENVKKDHLTIWKVKFPNGLIPNGSFGKEPKLYDITGIGMCWHSSQKTDWSVWKRADYRTAKLFDKYIWIDEVLTGLQSTPGGGNRRDVEPQILLPIKKEKVKVQFLKDFKGFKAGDVVDLSWIVATNYIYREKCIEKFPEPKPVKKEEKIVYSTKEEKTIPEDKQVKKAPVKRKRKPRKKATK